ncbi:MAG TPA: histidine phosphatase family protein [bacterium]|nr:histidine phosphatase family protein [bacterium]
MLTLFYSPHAASVDNEAGRASGHADVPLSAIGCRQAHVVGRHYAMKALHAVFCSDLQRAYTTAEIAFSGRGLPIARDARLRECDYDDLTQCPTTQLEEALARHITEPFPNGQSVVIVAWGVGDFLRHLLREHDGKTIAVIGHRTTRYGLDYWCGDASLEEIVRARWEWRDIPVCCYEVNARDLERRSAEAK